MKSPKISDLLNKINRAVENPSFPGISKIERDLLMQYIRELYENVDESLTTEFAGQKTPLKESVTIEPVLIKRPAIRPNENLLISEEVKEEKITPSAKQEEVAVTRPTIIAQTEVKPVQKVEAKTEKTIQAPAASINESIKTAGTLNEKLKTTATVEMHKKLASKPLKELIDLNKKFVLLNELFKGNAEAYSSAIAHIDTLQDYETAQTFVSTQLAANYFWDESKQSTRMFAKLIKLKFGIE